MKYRRMEKSDAPFLTSIFSTPEYELFFSENETTADEWARRMEEFQDMESLLVYTDSKPVGWLMYSISESVCFLDILVLLPSERKKGYGSTVIHDLMSNNPTVHTINLDVQKRNQAAFDFYTKMGFRVTGNEVQPVGDGFQDYYRMRKDIVR